MKRRLAACLAICLSLPAASAVAGTIASTSYQYYFVSGRSAVDLYDSMLKRGPHVDGEKAYAATSATSSQDGRLVQGKSCRIEDYKVKINFVIRLPKLRDAAKLPAAERQRFDRFAQFLRRHEETHRSIWLDCAAGLEAKVDRIVAKTCGEAEAKADRLWTDMRKSCALKHQAFDAAEQKRLMVHPFLRYVLTKKSHDTAAASAQ